MRWSSLCAPALACGALLAADVPRSAQSNPPTPSPWTVTLVRERRADETPLEESNPYLKESPGNYAPGPDSLVARVSIIQRRGHIEILDLRTGKAERLLEATAALPMWSPDGRYISCVSWKSTRQPHELMIVNVASKKVLIDPHVRASGTKAKWSPDSRKIVASGVINATPRSMLYSVSVPDGRVSVLDSLQVLMDYDFSWSPDGRFLAFNRPTALDEMGEYTIAADLWIADVDSGKSWPLIEAKNWVETNPLWLTDHSILVHRSARTGTELGPEQVVVVEIARSKEK